MRRVTISVIAVGAALLLGSPALAVDPSPSAAAATSAAQGKKMCKLADNRLTEVSGLVATASGFVAVNTAENVESPDPSHQKIFVLTSACKVSKAVSYSGGGSLSPEDIVRAKDGTMWIADTGQSKTRTTVALWKLPAALTAPQLFRVSFPEGDKHEVKSLLVNGDGTPILVTYETDRTALIYTPSAPLAAGQTGQLKKIGKIDILPTATDNIFGGYGRKGFVGGAVSPDGAKVVLRTQADAYEWDVSDGDVLAALKTQPRVTGLPRPAERVSGAITYSNDGSLLVTAPRMDVAEDKDTATLLNYTPTTKGYVAPPTVETHQGSWLMSKLKELSLDQVYMLLAGVGFLGLILVAVGVFGMINGKKKRAKAAAAAKKARRQEREAYDDFGEPGDNAATAYLAPVHGYDNGYDNAGYPPPQPNYPPQPYADGGYAEPGWQNPPPQPGPRQPDQWSGGGRGY
jgi:hypothetical protein